MRLLSYSIDGDHGFGLLTGDRAWYLQTKKTRLQMRQEAGGGRLSDSE